VINHRPINPASFPINRCWNFPQIQIPIGCQFPLPKNRHWMKYHL
jgi:hypothetical protein